MKGFIRPCQAPLNIVLLDKRDSPSKLSFFVLISSIKHTINAVEDAIKRSCRLLISFSAILNAVATVAQKKTTKPPIINAFD
jgi:hypothetical protein